MVEEKKTTNRWLVIAIRSRQVDDAAQIGHRLEQNLRSEPVFFVFLFFNSQKNKQQQCHVNHSFYFSLFY